MEQEYACFTDGGCNGCNRDWRNFACECLGYYLVEDCGRVRQSNGCCDRRDSCGCGYRRQKHDRERSEVCGTNFVESRRSNSFWLCAHPVGCHTKQLRSLRAPPAKWDPGYRLLVAGGAYSETPSPTTIKISGLTVGHKYVVQIFEAFWNANFATVFVGGNNQSSALNLTGDARTGSSASSVPQYVTGTFVADSESASVSLTSSTGYVIFDAVQVRDLGAPSAGK